MPATEPLPTPAPAVPDVLVIGEVLIEVSMTQPLASGVAATIGFSGDVLNSAAAAAAAGARVELLTRLPDGDTGNAMLDFASALSIGTAWTLRQPGEPGVYLNQTDAGGARQFVYARGNSAARSLSVLDLPVGIIDELPILLSTGITCAISESARELVLEACRRARTMVYDPNFRPRLSSVSSAKETLRVIAAEHAILTPAWPSETQALLGVDTAREAAAACLDLGAAAVAITCGERGVLVHDGTRSEWIPAIAAPSVIDQTGAGDAFAGTLAARLAVGDDLWTSAELACAAASLSVTGTGGLGTKPSLDKTRLHLGQARAPRAEQADIA
jgi:2-dehydro-3-deoxygluconokinase